MTLSPDRVHDSSSRASGRRPAGVRSNELAAGGNVAPYRRGSAAAPPSALPVIVHTGAEMAFLGLEGSRRLLRSRDLAHTQRTTPVCPPLTFASADQLSARLLRRPYPCNARMCRDLVSFRCRRSKRPYSSSARFFLVLPPVAAFAQHRPRRPCFFFFFFMCMIRFVGFGRVKGTRYIREA